MRVDDPDHPARRGQDDAPGLAVRGQWRGLEPFGAEFGPLE
jgi:hypothetical protein